MIMDIYMDNYGHMRRRKTNKIYDWQIKGSEYMCILNKLKKKQKELI